MVSRKFMLFIGGLLVVRFAAAQTTAPVPAPTTPPAPGVAAAASQVDGGTPTWIRAETAEQRRARLGTNDDPGPDPDPTKVWSRFGKLYKIEKYDRRWSRETDQPGIIRPFGAVYVSYELYQQNDKWVWVWVPEQTLDAPPPTPEPQTRYTTHGITYLKKLQPEFAPLSVPEAKTSIQFVESSEGLPSSGSWRNSLTVADMNNDGNPDIVAPPPRGGGGVLPAIFLGDGTGRWKIWSTVMWPYHIQYGGVDAADFDKDGNMDLAFAVHLSGLRVFLGDGKGNFRDSSKGLPIDDFPTRRVVATDLDKDGAVDLLAINEGPTMGTMTGPSGKVRAYLNRKKGTEWQSVAAADANRVLAGDWLAVGKFNADPYPDFVGSSNYFHAHELIYLSKGPRKWEPVKGEGYVVPYLSYYWAVTTGRFSSKQTDDVIMSYSRHWPSDMDPKLIPKPPLDQANGLDRVTFAGGTPKRIPIVRTGSTRPILGVASGDFDGDKNLDLIYSAWDPRELVILLGDGKGGFTRAKTEGLKAENNTNYDLTVEDVNKDGRPDVLIMYESASESRFGAQDGSIRVFLNRGLVSATAAR
ncbi:MAG TPA: VCBS repeat-containing protein [Thermoanaerobaculia bacterium]|nr:VCBS repeat-containing protein [Thermoanaerobaculia bacterium]